MIEVSIKIENLDKLRDRFNKAPGLTLKYLSRAIQASIFEVEKQAVDRNFQFKTPRSRRTGWLEKSFAFGRYIAPLRGSIGPTAMYSPFVYFGTSRGIQPNMYMDRIARASTSHIEKHFQDAVDKVVNDIATI